MITDITKVPLSRGEEARLARLEGVVDNAIRSFVEAGPALAAISNGTLYRATHATFEAYVADRFGYARSYAYRLMDAAETAQIVSPIGDIQNEAQARELRGLAPDEKRDVYQRALAETAGRPTAGAIWAARQHVVRPAASKPRRAPLPDQFGSAMRELEKVCSRLTRLHDDDRFTANRGVIRDRNIGRLTTIAASLKDLRDDLAGCNPGQTVINLEPVEATQ